jgi:2-polyprenyl-3-methyl-5-hydroxy-6-metoxy-1,4-benzoquinol methylase
VLLRAVAPSECRLFVSPEVGSVLDRAHCLICGGEGVHWLGPIDRELRRCRNCRFTWIVQGVETTPNGKSIYETDDSIVLDPAQADYYRDETAVDAAREKLAWVRRYARSGARLLDVGANVGFFVREAAREFRATGIEPGAAVVEFARREHGVDLLAGSVYDVGDHLTGQFDIVTLFDVLEHLADPGLALEQCRRLLRPGGYLFVTTPDAGSLVARMLGRHWHYIDLHEHVALFNRRHVTTLLARTGLEMVAVRTIGRSYRWSYIRRRLALKGRHSTLLRIAHVGAWPLSFWPTARMWINLGDVMGIVARVKEPCGS